MISLRKRYDLFFKGRRQNDNEEEKKNNKSFANIGTGFCHGGPCMYHSVCR
jgi:hypothetical protein